MDYEVKSKTYRQAKKTWCEVTEENCHTQQICKEDAMDRWKCTELLKDVVCCHKDRVWV